LTTLEVQDWDTAYQAGLSATEKGQFEEALGHFQQAALKAEDFADNDERKGDTFYFLGLTQARADLILVADHNLTRALKLRIEALGMGDLRVAQTLYTMGEIYRREMRIGDAQNALVVASEIVDKLGVKEALAADIFFATAVVLHQAGHYENSLQQAVKAAAVMPQDHPMRPALVDLTASLAIAHQAYALAAQTFEKKAASQEPGLEQNTTLGALADMQLAQGLWEDALATTRRALEVFPTDSQMLRRQAVAFSRSGQFEKAEASLLKAREETYQTHDKAELTSMLAEVQIRAKNGERAADYYLEALRLIQRSPLIRAQWRLALGKIYLGLERFDEARKQFACVARTRKHMRRPPYLLLAEALLHLGALYNRDGDGASSEKRLSYALYIMESDHVPLEGLTPEQKTHGQNLTVGILRELSASLALQGRFGEAAGVLESVVLFDDEADKQAQQLELLAELFRQAENLEMAEHYNQQARLVRNPPDEPA